VLLSAKHFRTTTQ